VSKPKSTAHRAAGRLAAFWSVAIEALESDRPQVRMATITAGTATAAPMGMVKGRRSAENQP
jgi:hypothetical protein